MTFHLPPLFSPPFLDLSLTFHCLSLPSLGLCIAGWPVLTAATASAAPAAADAAAASAATNRALRGQRTGQGTAVKGGERAVEGGEKDSNKAVKEQ